MSKKKANKQIAKAATVVAENRKKTAPALTAATGDKGVNSMTNWMLILVFLLPIIFSRETMDPVIAVRYIYLSSFVLLFILFFYYMRNRVTNGSPFLSATPPTLVKWAFGLGIAYCTWNIIAMSVSVNKESSYYDVARQFLNIILFWLIVQMVRKEEQQVIKICKILVVVAFIESLAGILQYYDLAFHDLPGNESLPYGFMANRNLFGSAQVLILPFVLFVIYKGSKLWKYSSALAAILVGWSVILSQTRAAWLALAVQIVVGLVLVLIFLPPLRKKWIIGTLSGIVLIAAITGLMLLSDKEGELSQSIKARVSSLTNVNQATSDIYGSGNERLKIWKKTIELIKAHPFIGVGPANWNVVIPEFGSGGLLWGKGAAVPDQPHNVYLKVASETGIPGAILYFGMWILIAIAGFNTLRKPQPEERRVLSALILAGLAAWATDNMFSFSTDRIEHSMYIFLMAGIILGVYANGRPASSESESGRKNSWILQKNVALFLCFIALVNIIIGYSKYNFEMHMQLAMNYEKENNYTDELAEVEKGKSFFVSLDVNGTPLELRAVNAYRELKENQKALEAGKKAVKYNPSSAMIYNNIGIVYTNMNEFDKALEYYNKALKYTPDYDLIVKNLAVNYYNVKNDSACIRMLRKIDITGDAFLTGLMTNASKRMAALK